MKLSDRPLREQKAGRTRLALLQALTTRLRTRSFAEVGVKELCQEVGISEPTFFNHFGTKGALLEYFISLWSIELQSRARTGDARSSGVARLRLLFELAGKAIRANPGVMQEIIAHQIRVRRQPIPYPLNAAERLIRFPELADVCAFEPMTVSQVVRAALQDAQRAQELKPDVDLHTTEMLLMAVFFGVPAAAPHAARTPQAYLAGYESVMATLTR